LATINVFRDISLPPRDEEPAYKSLARAIRERILVGQLRPGDQLPTKREVAEALHLSIHTVQHAYNLLVREMLLVGGQGVRTAVAGARPRHARRSTPESTASGQSAQNHLVGIVKEVEIGVEGATVRLELLSSQCVTLPTSRAAIDWLQIARGEPATVTIDGSAILLTRADDSLP